VLDAVVEHLQREAQIGGYEAARERRDRLEHAYDAIAALIGCERDEVAIVENATRAWDMAFYAMRFAPGDRILTSRAEYASNYIALKQVADRTGASVEFVADGDAGGIDLDALEAMLDERVKLVSLVHVPTQSGLVQPAAAVGAIARAAGVPLLLDACQSVGQMPVDVREIGCDMLSATGRKFLRGPRGTGFLYVRRDLAERLEPPLLDLHAAEWQADGSYRIRADARRFENWESYIAGKVGLGVAVDYALAWGLEAIRERVVALATRLRALLAEIDGVTVLDVGPERCAIATFAVAGRPASEVAAALGEERINVSVSPLSSSVADFAARGVTTDIVRASVHYYNTDEELDRLAGVVGRLAGRRQSTFS
jgi:selenocysteine lyase/cysteine desulfurase